MVKKSKKPKKDKTICSRCSTRTVLIYACENQVIYECPLCRWKLTLMK